MAKKLTHLHKYKRVKHGRKGRVVIKCMFPSCTHYIEPELAEGNLSTCNRCGEPFVLTKENLKLARPHCTNCIERKSKIPLSDVESFLDSIG